MTRDALAAEPFGPDSLRSAADYLKERNGHAMLVYYRDNLVFEEYFNGWYGYKPHRLASGTKSFSGAMIAAAVEDRLLELDEKVVDTIVEWKDDARKSQITIRQLLSLTSGIVGGNTRERAPSYAKAVTNADAKFPPGLWFQYGPIPYQIFGELMRRKLAATKDSVEAYMQRRVFDPIGLKLSGWGKDTDGNIDLPNGAQLLAREWAKFGLLIQHQGSWQGRQILPAKVLQECFVGTEANPSYGITFWLKSAASMSNDFMVRKAGEVDERLERRAAWIPNDLVMAWGLGNQRLYIIPSLDLVVVQFAESSQIRPDDFLKRLLVSAK